MLREQGYPHAGSDEKGAVPHREPGALIRGCTVDGFVEHLLQLSQIPVVVRDQHELISAQPGKKGGFILHLLLPALGNLL